MHCVTQAGYDVDAGCKSNYQSFFLRVFKNVTVVLRNERLELSNWAAVSHGSSQSEAGEAEMHSP